MKFFMDLHIHSVLSPCADLLMTVDNIINKLKEENIKIFSITDHNTYKNSEFFQKRAEKEEILFIPGIEVQSAEEVHVLVYFRKMSDLKEFGNLVYEKLSKMKNREEVFGYQLILDEDDEYAEKEEAFLAGNCSMGIDEIYEKAKEFRAIIVPAHIDRSSSIISNLGYIPEINFDALEVYNENLIEKIKVKYKIKKPIFSSSDAHFINLIKKAKMYVNMEKLDIESFFNAVENNEIFLIEKPKGE